MPKDETIQQSFLRRIKEKIGPHVSLADELSSLLGISKDSVYRRMRDETSLTLHEIQVLCKHYEVSVDELFKDAFDVFHFQYKAINRHDFSFEKYLNYILDALKLISQFEEKELVFIAKDIPIFHHFNYPHLLEFKIFFWMKTYLDEPAYADEIFTLGKVPESLIEVSKKIWELYLKIPCTEIWSFETINTNLKQIEYYLESGLMESTDLALTLCDELSQQLFLIKHQAKVGRKVSSLDIKYATENSEGGKFDVFINEILIADNTIFFKMGDLRNTFLTYNTLNLLSTNDQEFCAQTESYIQQLKTKSTHISITSEKERNRFFKVLQERIIRLKSKIMNQMNI